jgi:hypothetical protein
VSLHGGTAPVQAHSGILLGRSMAADAFFLKKRLNVAPKVDIAWRLRCQQSGECGRRGERENRKGMHHNEPSWRRLHRPAFRRVYQSCQPIHSGRFTVPPDCIVVLNGLELAGPPGFLRLQS